jgi:protein SCO1/2
MHVPKTPFRCLRALAILTPVLLTLPSGTFASTATEPRGSLDTATASRVNAPVPRATAPIALPGAPVQPSTAGSGYVCPKHPDVALGRPGTCPICGMALVRAGAAPDHSGHEDAAEEASADPHAQHRHMMGKGGYARSEHRYELPDLALVGMDGKPTTLLREVDIDQPVMLNFIFTTCTTICPVLSATFAQVQRELGPKAAEMRMVSITIDPEYDTPEQLRAYAQRFDAGDQWGFFTGELADIVAIQRAFDAFRGSKMNHEPLTFLRAAPGEPWVRINGIASGSDIVAEYQNLAAN